MEAEDILELAVDELALAVLRDFDQGGGWNAYNWMLEADRQYPGRKDVSAAFSEAWAWLLGRGLVARDFRKSSAEAVFVTRAGRRAIDEGLAEVRAVERLQVELHPALESKVRHVYLVGDYDTAVFKAFKEVEIRVRAVVEASDSLLGTNLMQEAFREGGRLWSEDFDRGEQVARMELFKGAIGFLKNPASHREVRYDDATEAAEAVLLADLLMRVLDRVEAERALREGTG
jgi:uncharacterized protein (TIGR02391 family)